MKFYCFALLGSLGDFFKNTLQILPIKNVWLPVYICRYNLWLTHIKHKKPTYLVFIISKSRWFNDFKDPIQNNDSFTHRWWLKRVRIICGRRSSLSFETLLVIRSQRCVSQSERSTEVKRKRPLWGLWTTHVKWRRRSRWVNKLLKDYFTLSCPSALRYKTTWP